MKLDYDAKSPITGNECVIIEADEKTDVNSYMCMESGYTTTDEFKIDSDHTKVYEAQVTDLMNKVKYIDKELGLVWYPAFLNVPGVGMLYCNGTTKKDMIWEVADIIDIEGDERLKYPIPGKKDEYFTSRLDTENSKKFKGSEFAEALDYYYSLVSKVYA